MTVIDFANPPGILVLMGLPASGKSTLALQWVARDPANRMRVNYDEMRETLYGPGWKFNRAQEASMKAEAFRQAKSWIDANPYEHSVVVDNLNLTEGARKPWLDLARSLNVPVDVHEMDTNMNDCVRQDRYRQKRVGEAVINRWALRTGWIDWTDYKNKFMVVDVDGTLANTDHRQQFVRPPEDWHDCPEPILQHGVCSACHKLNPKHYKWKKDWLGFFKGVADDKPITPIMDIVTELALNYHLIIVSGRPLDLCGKQTEDWLRKWKVPYEFLFMRDGGDSRADTIVKQEILEYLPKDRIAFVLDDRDSVVKMWRDNGLTCLQVAPGDF